MTDVLSSLDRPLRGVMIGGMILLLLGAFLAVPSAARTDIQHIQNGDKIFVYEQNLDITGLRTGGNPVIALRKYVDDDPTRALLNEVSVVDDTSFDVLPELFGDLLGVYYAHNPAVGTMGSVVVLVPSVTIDAVLANPNHVYSIAGLSIPDDTPVAFKITSTDVGSAYHAGSLYPATVDLVLTAPGGAQLTTVQGLDFSRMNVSSQAFYTDDPGRPGAITLGGLGTGTFGVQAKWRDPASWYNQAPNSNILTFIVGRTTVSQTTPTPVTPPVTTRTTVTTVAVTTPATTALPPTATTGVPATSPATAPPTTTSPSPSPTTVPVGAWIGLLSPALAALLLITRARR